MWGGGRGESWARKGKVIGRRVGGGRESRTKVMFVYIVYSLGVAALR